jgi:dolichol-phosphate mannosyltransferase
MTQATLVVIPTYNERDNLSGLIERVLGALDDAEVLVVDDASPDGTGALADELAARDPRVHALRRAGKLGMGTAYVEGFEWARGRGYQRVVQMDADGSHEPAELSGLVGRLADADLVVGSRFIPGGSAPGWGAHRIALNRVAGLYCRAVLGFELTDPTSGFRALSRSALDRLAEQPIRSEGFAFQIEVAYRVHHQGLRVVEHPICFKDRQLGRSKLSAEIVAEAVLVVPLLRLCAVVGVV